MSLSSMIIIKVQCHLSRLTEPRDIYHVSHYIYSLIVLGHKLSFRGPNIEAVLWSRPKHDHWTASILGPGTTVYGLKLAL